MRSAIVLALAVCGVVACSGSSGDSNACPVRIVVSGPLGHWSDVAADTTYCNNALISDRTSECGPYHVRVLATVDTGGDTYYYDAASGDLVAIFHSTGMVAHPGTTCSAGPSRFVPPSCPGAASTPTVHPSCNADGGTPD